MRTRHTESLSPADSTWWRMESPVNQMVITGVLTFDRELPFERVREVFRARFLRYHRFRQRLEEPRWSFGLPRWVDDERFDLDHHLRRVTLPPPADEAAMRELVGRLMSTPLDYGRPLWEFHFVENHPGGSALVARLHHCIADGIALIRVLLTLDDVPGNETVAATWWERSRRLVPPDPVRRPLARLGRTAGAVVADLVRLVTMRSDPPTRFRGAVGAGKRAAWSETIPLAEIREIGRAAGATLHDVLAAAVAGALRRYLVDRGDAVGTRDLRAVVPVNLRRPEEGQLLGNEFGLVFLPLPVGVADPVQRLRAVQYGMSRLKRSPEAVVVYGLLTLFGRMTRPLVGLVVAFLGRKATLVMTDVPGPRERVAFCGANLTSLMAWVPQSGRLSLGVSLLSYGDQLQVGVAADAGLVPDPEAIVAAYHLSLRELAERLRPTPAGAR